MPVPPLRCRVRRAGRVVTGVGGRAGKTAVDTMRRRAAERRAIDVVADQVGCPTDSAELARGLRALVEAGAGGVVHATGGGSTSWYGFAREILRQAGEDPEKIRQATTGQLGRPAPRPAHSVLSNERFAELVGFRLADWPDALGDYLARRRVGVRR